MCTALEKLKEEGRQEGRLEGREEGREENTRELVLEWTKDGFSVKEIAKLLKRSEEFVKKIQDESEILV